MNAHLRANLLLLAFTLVACCFLYPVLLFLVGGTLFPTAARGNLVTEKGPDGKDVVRGSRLIAQPFTDDAYFWPRPSAASHNATASGASNYGANNPKLRDRVAQQLGPLVKYRKSSASAGADQGNPRTPQQDVEAWFVAEPDRVAAWASEFEVAATNWAKTDLAGDKYGLPGEYIQTWSKDHPEVVADWKKANPKKAEESKPEELVGLFFVSYAKHNPGKWPGVVDVEQPDKTKIKRIEPVSADAALAPNSPTICANFFDAWLRDPANAQKAADLEPVAADMVMTSASGLDPHITLRNALSVYQLDRVAAKRTPPGGNGSTMREDVAKLVRDLSFTPLGGLVGEPLVNVLELNRELDLKFPMPAVPGKVP